MLKITHIFGFRYQYCDGLTQSIASQRLNKYPATDMHATIQGRPKCAHGTIGRVFSIAMQQPVQQWSG
jgi:hypothetical protein